MQWLLYPRCTKRISGRLNSRLAIFFTVGSSRSLIDYFLTANRGLRNDLFSQSYFFHILLVPFLFGLFSISIFYFPSLFVLLFPPSFWTSCFNFFFQFLFVSIIFCFLFCLIPFLFVSIFVCFTFHFLFVSILFHTKFVHFVTICQFPFYLWTHSYLSDFFRHFFNTTYHLSCYIGYFPEPNSTKFKYKNKFIVIRFLNQFNF